MDVIQILAAGVGALLLIAGWLLYFTAISIACGFLGAALGLAVGLLGADLLQIGTPWAEVMAGVLAAGFGVLGVWLAKTFHKATFFCIGFSGGTALGWLSMKALRANPVAGLEWMAVDSLGAAYVVALAFIAAFLVACMDWLFISVVSSSLGAWLVILGTHYDPMVGLAFALAGVFIQTGLAWKLRRRIKENSRARDEKK